MQREHNSPEEPGGDIDRRRKRGVVDEGVAPEVWKRVSPITPMLNSWRVLAILVAIILFQSMEVFVDLAKEIAEWGIGRLILIAVAALLVLIGIVGVYSYLSWRAMTYAVTDQAVWMRTGIVFRQQRHVRLERIQAVDVIYPLLGRIFGLGKLTVEAAGGSGSSLQIGFLKTETLDDVRAEILALAAGLDLTPVGFADSAGVSREGGEEIPGSSAHKEGDFRADSLVDVEVTEEVDALSPSPQPTPVLRASLEAPETVVYSVDAHRLLVSLALSASFVISVVIFLASLVFLGVATYLWGVGITAAILPGYLPFLIAAGSIMWARFAREFNFQAAVSPDGIRVRRGLVERRAETIPPRRVHAVQITQPFFWRKRNWYRVVMSQAINRTDSSGQNTVSQALLPVGTREEAMVALWLVLPDLGVDDPEAFFDAAVRGTGPDRQFTGIARSAWVVDPLVKHRRAIATTKTCVVTRDGRVTRTASFAPYERIQSVVETQGPWRRSRGLASLRACLVPGPVYIMMPHLSEENAARVRNEMVARSHERRAAEPAERWFRRVQEPLQDRQDANEAEGGSADITGAVIVEEGPGEPEILVAKEAPTGAGTGGIDAVAQAPGMEGAVEESSSLGDPPVSGRSIFAPPAGKESPFVPLRSGRSPFAPPLSDRTIIEVSPGSIFAPPPEETVRATTSPSHSLLTEGETAPVSNFSSFSEKTSEEAAGQSSSVSLTPGESRADVSLVEESDSHGTLRETKRSDESKNKANVNGAAAEKGAEDAELGIAEKDATGEPHDLR